MKRLIYCLATLALLLVCACSQSEKTAREAKTSMESIIKELARNPESVKIENINAIYENDSLTILRFDFTGKNGLGVESTDKMEYIYLVENGKKYEAIHELDADSVYLDTPTWETRRNGSIYENLDYDAAIRYLAASHINRYGRVVGDKTHEQDVKISVPTGTGAWELKHYTDSFGDETSDKYLVLTGEGVFSNSATNDSKLKAIFFIDNNMFSFRLFEYGSHPVKDDDAPYMTRIKDSTGAIYDFRLFNAGQSGQIGTFSAYDMVSNDKYNRMLDILKNGGEITVLMNYSNYGQRDYRFKLNVDGFENAIEFI